jgi:hypothetical protein
MSRSPRPLLLQVHAPQSGNSRVADVRAAVAEAIRRPEGYGLDAHRTMLDLATSRAGVTRLVTTNFDLLFALAISDYGYVLSKGRVVTEGKPSELAKTKEVHQAYFG